MLPKRFAFVPASSSFTPPFIAHAPSQKLCRHALRGGSGTGVPTMVAPRNVRRSEEIKRLTKQLEELRSTREHLAKKEEPSTSQTTPTASAAEVVESTPTGLDSTSASPSSTEIRSTLKFGKHAADSRFLSVTSVADDEFYPRILPVTGVVPGMTADEFRNTPAMPYSKLPQNGNLFIARPPKGMTNDLMALPCTDAMSRCKDPVVVLIDPVHFSHSKLPITPGESVVLLVDRAVREEKFNDQSLFVWDVQGSIVVGWLDTLPSHQEAVCLGRVMYGLIEVNPELRLRKSCWEEENETYM